MGYSLTHTHTGGQRQTKDGKINGKERPHGPWLSLFDTLIALHFDTILCACVCVSQGLSAKMRELLSESFLP